MFKQISQFFITRYPLLWNTRFVFFIPVALLIHLLFYLVGYKEGVPIDELYLYHHWQFYTITLFSVLISLIFIILWLVYYLRNNPFKTFYRLPRFYLFAEFMLVLLVFLSSSTFFLTFRQGLYDRVENDTEQTDLLGEINLVNLSGHFMPYQTSDFNQYNNCDSLRSRERRDSAIKANGFERDLYIETSGIPDENLSYLAYCGQSIFAHSGGLMDRYELNKIAERWLLEGEKDSVKHLVERVLALCAKYNVDYRLSPAKVVENVFEDSSFRVYPSHLINKYDEAVYEFDYVLEQQNLHSALERIDEVRTGFWNRWIVFGILYTCLGFSILLFTYRITKRRIWFVGLVGSGVLAVLVGLIMGANRMNEEDFYLIVIVLFSVFSIGSLAGISTKGNKQNSGILFNWFIWLLPAIVPCVWAYLKKITYTNCDYRDYLLPCTQTEFYQFLSNNFDSMLALNLAVIVIIMLMVIIPAAMKWQANPEE